MKRHIVPIFRNPYLVIPAVFLLWMAGCDRNDVSTQYELYAKLKGLEKTRQFYLEEISRIESDKRELMTNQATIEKFAREKYRMKKDDEEIFVIVPQQDPAAKDE